VRIARAFTAGNAPAAALARRGRAAYLDPPDRAVAELGVEPLDEHRRQQPDLGGPGRRVRRDRQLAVGEAVRLGVRGQVRADDLGPPAEHRAHRGPLLPAVRVEQPADRAGQRLRILPARPPSSRGAGRAGGSGRGYAGPFGIIALVRSWPAAEAGREVSPGPRVRLGHGERLDRQPRQVLAPWIPRSPQSPRVLSRRRPARHGCPYSSLVTVPALTVNRAPSSTAGTSAGTAAVIRTCSAPATSAASRSRRPVSSSANTSSRISTGSSRPSRSSAKLASRSASASDQDSPWLAYPRAGRPPT